MRLISWITSAVLLCAWNVSAHADLITTFTLTHGTDTFQFSLSPSTPLQYEQLNVVQEFEYQVPLAVDGVTQLADEGFEQLQPLGVGAEFYISYVTGVVNNVIYSTDLFEQGIQVYSYANGILTFAPGTYVFPQVNVEDFNSAGSSSEMLEPGDTLVITQSDVSATPEPSAFWLLGTGLLGSLGLVGRPA